VTQKSVCGNAFASFHSLDYSNRWRGFFMLRIAQSVHLCDRLLAKRGFLRERILGRRRAHKEAKDECGDGGGFANFPAYGNSTLVEPSAQKN
jgi:hypothetical protein